MVMEAPMMTAVAIINKEVGKGVEEGGAEVGVESGAGSVAVAYIIYLILLK
jgi:hypothetical protein